MRRGSFLLSIGLIAAISLGAYSAYIYFQNDEVSSELNSYNMRISALNTNVVELEGDNLEQSLVAKQKLSELQSEAVLWSEVIDEILDTVPVRRGRDIVDVLSYSGSGSRDITMSLKTVPGSNSPYFDVADLIAEFNSNEMFDSVFVPSIGASTDEDGREILSFSMTVRYLGDVAEIESASGDLEILDRSSDRENEAEELNETIGDILGDSLDDESEEDADSDENDLGEPLAR